MGECRHEWALFPVDIHGQRVMYIVPAQAAGYAAASFCAICGMPRRDDLLGDGATGSDRPAIVYGPGGRGGWKNPGR